MLALELTTLSRSAPAVYLALLEWAGHRSAAKGKPVLAGYLSMKALSERTGIRDYCTLAATLAAMEDGGFIARNPHRIRRKNGQPIRTKAGRPLKGQHIKLLDPMFNIAFLSVFIGESRKNLCSGKQENPVFGSHRRKQENSGHLPGKSEEKPPSPMHCIDSSDAASEESISVLASSTGVSSAEPCTPRVAQEPADALRLDVEKEKENEKLKEVLEEIVSTDIKRCSFIEQNIAGEENQNKIIDRRDDLSLRLLGAKYDDFAYDSNLSALLHFAEAFKQMYASEQQAIAESKRTGESFHAIIQQQYDADIHSNGNGGHHAGAATNGAGLQPVDSKTGSGETKAE